MYDNQLLNIDAQSDPRLKRATGTANADQIELRNGKEITRPYAFRSLQCQLGSSIQPREMLWFLLTHSKLGMNWAISQNQGPESRLLVWMRP